MSNISSVALLLIAFSIVATFVMFIIYAKQGYVDFYDGTQVI